MYFPTDHTTLQFDETDLDVILSDILSVYENINPKGFIIGVILIVISVAPLVLYKK